MLKKVLLSTGAALLAGYIAFHAAFRMRFTYLAHLYPHDGQIGLDAMMVAMIASIAAVSLTAIAIVVVTKTQKRNGS